MTQLLNSAEGGTIGATVSTANSGGSSGNAWDAVNIGALAGLTYSSAQSAHGRQSLSVTAGSPAANSITEWTTSLTASTVSQIWFRAYFFFPSFSATQCRIVSVRNGATYCGGIATTSAGNIVTLNASGGTQTTSTTVLPTNKWVRLEGYIIGSATTGQVQVQIFATNYDGATPDETNTSGATINTNSALNRLDFGNPSSSASYSFFMDDMGGSTTGLMGPVIVLTSTFEGGASGTTISTGNSGPPSGNAFDLVSIGTGATVAYDNTQSAHGSLSQKTATAGTAATGFTAWTTSMGTQVTAFFRFYAYLTGNPAGGIRVCEVRSSGSHAASIVLTAAGTIQLAGGTGFSTLTTMVTALPLNAWFRMEGFFTGDASAGAVSASIYLSMDSTTPTETKSVTGQNTTGVLNQYWFGQGSTVANSPAFWLDDVAFTNNSVIGPVVQATNNFEGGTQGTTLSTSNTGGTSGNVFDAINTGTGGATLAFDNTHSAHGSFSCQIATTTPAATPLAIWTNNTFGTSNQVWYRQYLYLTGNPASPIRPVAFRSNGSLAAAIGISATGKLQLINTGNSVTTTFTNAIPLNQWFRIEGYVVGNASTGVINCSLYASEDSTAATETETSTGQNTNGVLSQYWFGEQVSLTNVPSFWMDDLGVSTYAPLGPVGSNGIVVGTTPVLLGSCPAIAGPFAQGQLVLISGGAPIFLGGGSAVTATSGAQVAANTTFRAPLYPGDQIWACTATGTSAVTVLQTGA